MWSISTRSIRKLSGNFSLFYYGCSGYGGGYNEREGVEYIHREDSDDEFDEVLDNTCIRVQSSVHFAKMTSNRQ